jgi:bifunctional ADP-heptose synthase (sugar kinase/adenylyltransferase)
VKRDRLEELLAKFPSRRVAVLGDFFLDKYLEVDPRLAETSVETGKRANQVVEIRTSPGAAGTVVNNLAALGAGELHAIGATGDDGEAYDLRRGLEARNCSIAGLVPFSFLHTPTYLKPRDVNDPSLEGEHERYDTKNRAHMPTEVWRRVISELEQLVPKVDAVIVADQVENPNNGVIGSVVRNDISRLAQRYPNVCFWADSRTQIWQFRDVIVKPNQFEAFNRANPRPGDTVPMEKLRGAVGRLRFETGAPVCCTLGANGMLVSDPELTVIPGVKLTGPTDTTGAGDSATAGAVLALAAGATLPEAALVGCLVASITVQQLATTGTATPAQVLDRLALWQEQQG